jgi:anti-anti-sigma factor
VVDSDENPGLRLSGAVDFAAVTHLESGVTEVLSHDGEADVLVDMADVTFIDSAGIALLLRIAMYTRRRGHVAVLRSVSPDIARCSRCAA